MSSSAPPPASTSAARPSSEPRPEVVAALVAHHRQFLTFLERRAGSRAVAEDILQDAFVRGMAKIESLRDDESALAWFYRLLRNAVIDHHRRRGASARQLAEFEAELETFDPRGEVHGAICTCVSELAEMLKPEYADALRHVEIGGMAVKDYAARIGVSASNAGVRVFRARKALLEQVERCCGSCAEHGCFDCTCRAKAGHPAHGSHSGSS